MPGPSSGGVFISYRRRDAAHVAGRLYDQIANLFGDDQIFMDVDTIALGIDFAEVITQAVSTCEVLVAIIGPRWITETDEQGRRRLDHPDDLVRLEIAAALEHNVPVIPILVDGAMMPRRQDLPEALTKLARLNPLNLRHDTFRHDSRRLVAEIERVLGGAEEAYGSYPVAEQIETLRVFLCHSSSDKPAVRSLHRRLQDEGVEPWLDEVDILPGQDWDHEIRMAIRNSHVVLVCLSRASINRTGYIQKEIRQVLDVADEQPENTIFLIPVRLEECKVPDRLGRWQWVDLFEEYGYGRLMLALAARRKDLIE